MTDNPDSAQRHPALELEPDLDDFYEAWHFLLDHPLFFYKGRFTDTNESGFEEALSMYVMKIDPETESCTGTTKDTATEVWLECGPYMDSSDVEAEADSRLAMLGAPSHDYELDVGGPTVEIAICRLARKVLERHGSYLIHRICSHCLRNRPAGPTDENEEWFCSPACEACGVAGFRTKPVEGRDDVVAYISPREYFDCEHWRGR